MGENKPKLKQLVEDIFATQEQEISCDTAVTNMAAAEHLSDEQSQQKFPQLWIHFHFCADCREEYALLMDLVQQDAAGILRAPARLPPIPTQQPTDSLLNRIASAIQILFPGFEPTVAQAVRSSQLGLFGDPTELQLSESLVVLLDLTINQSNASVRDLHCTVESSENEVSLSDAPALSFEGAPVWLLRDGQAVLQEQAFDSLGDVAFYAVEPGKYAMLFVLGGRDYVVNNLVIP